VLDDCMRMSVGNVEQLRRHLRGILREFCTDQDANFDLAFSRLLGQTDVSRTLRMLRAPRPMSAEPLVQYCLSTADLVMAQSQGSGGGAT
jgi:hypothetical protein